MPDETPIAPEPAASELEGLDPGELLARGLNTVRNTHGGRTWTPPTPEELVTALPQYRIESLLGHGGMGAVYRGVQTALDRLVAIKLLPLDVSLDRDFAERFVREAKTLARLNHPNIVAVYDFGTTTSGHLYFVMEYVEGTDLHRMIHGPGLSAEQTLEITIGVCEALQYAHGKGVVHRDIKPANVMVSTEGQVKVADFGLARLSAPDAQSPGTTVTGTVMGTPDYMAPEQTRGLHVDHRADIYSLGVMLYEMLCGQVPRGVFDPPSHKVRVDVRIDDVVLRAMQQEPERRYQNTREMKTDVDTIRTTPAGASPGVTPSVVSQTSAGNGGGMDTHSPQSTSTPTSRKATKRVPSGAAVALLVIAGAALIGGAVFWTQNPGAEIPEVAKNAALPDSDHLSPKTASPAPVTASSDFRPLFDGRTFAGWHGYRATTVPNGWEVKDGAMAANSRSVLVTEEEFEDFELTLEWRVNAAGNGGIFFRMNEVPPNAPSGVAPEFQLMDDANADPYKTGALHKAEHALKRAAKAVGEWNTARLLVRGGQCEHWVNEQLVCRYDLRDTATRERWRNLGIKSDFATATKGHIGLQAFTGEISYRNIRIRSAPAEVKVASAMSAAGTSAALGAGDSNPKSQQGRVIDLLALVDVQRDAIAGDWEMTPMGLLVTETYTRTGMGALVQPISKPGKFIGKGGPKLQLPYQPPEEYDFEIEFTPRKDGAAFGQILSSASGWFAWIFRKDRPGFGSIDRKNDVEVGTEPDGVVVKGDLSPVIGQRYRSTVEVRRNSLRGVMDGDEIVKLPEIPRHLLSGDRARLRSEMNLGLFAEANRTVLFHKITVREVTGTGKIALDAASPSVAPSTSTFASATKEQPFVNSLGMKFVPVPITGGPTGGQRVLFSIWETRVRDYEAFATETKRKWRKPDFEQEPEHPAVTVSWDEAQLFATWLTEREFKAGRLGKDERYRLPTDHEWSCAVGLGDREDAAEAPMKKKERFADAYPWGAEWPPPAGAGNFSGEEAATAKVWPQQQILSGYRDPFTYTAPVGSFAPNRFGIFDLGGNVREWCEDLWNVGSTSRVSRGTGFDGADRADLMSSARSARTPVTAASGLGFRLVLITGHDGQP